jgi:hypothetical protein
MPCVAGHLQALSRIPHNSPVSRCRGTWLCDVVVCHRTGFRGAAWHHRCKVTEGVTPASKHAASQSTHVAHLRLTVQHSSMHGLVTPSSGEAPMHRGNSEAHSHALYARRQSSHVHSCTSLRANELGCMASDLGRCDCGWAMLRCPQTAAPQECTRAGLRARISDTYAPAVLQQQPKAQVGKGAGGHLVLQFPGR